MAKAMSRNTGINILVVVLAIIVVIPFLASKPDTTSQDVVAMVKQAEPTSQQVIPTSTGFMVVYEYGDKGYLVENYVVTEDEGIQLDHISIINRSEGFDPTRPKIITHFYKN